MANPLIDLMRNAVTRQFFTWEVSAGLSPLFDIQNDQEYLFRNQSVTSGTKMYMIIKEFTGIRMRMNNGSRVDIRNLQGFRHLDHCLVVSILIFIMSAPELDIPMFDRVGGLRKKHNFSTHFPANFHDLFQVVIAPVISPAFP